VAARNRIPAAGAGVGGYTYNTPAPHRGEPAAAAVLALNAVHEYVTQFGASIALDTSGKLRRSLRGRGPIAKGRLT